MRILLVEDEPAAAHVLAKGLREQAYAVDLAGDGDSAIFQVGTTDYDAVILDVMLPVRDGFAVCRTIRESGCAVPILMGTARDAREARLDGARNAGPGQRRGSLPEEALRFRRAAAPVARAYSSRPPAAAARTAHRGSGR